MIRNPKEAIFAPATYTPGAFSRRKPSHQFSDRERAPAQIQQHVGDQLARAMIGDLAAAIDPNQRYPDVAQEVADVPAQTQREDRRMFHQPNLVGR